MTILNSLANTTLIITPLILLVLILVPVLDRKFASCGRYVLWLMVIAGLIIPLFAFIPNPVMRVEMSIPATFTQPVPVQEWEQTTIHTMPSQPVIISGSEAPVSGTQTIANTGMYSTATPVANIASNISARHILLFAWLFGLLFSAIYHTKSYISFKRFIKRWQKPETNPQILAILDVTKRSMGITATIGLDRCKGINAPMLIGFTNPTILLPACEYNQEELYFIFLHELVHFKRRDLLYKLALVVVKCIYWFNPAVHMMAKQANKDIETICDSLTITGLGMASRKKYSEILLSMANGPRPYRSYLTTHMNDGTKTLKHRFSNILGKTKRSGTILFILVGGLIFASGLIIGIGFAGAQVEAYTPTENLPYEDGQYTAIATPTPSPTPAFPTPTPPTPQPTESISEGIERTLAESHYYQDLDILHAMVFDEPRLVEHVFDHATDLLVDPSANNVSITTGGDSLIIRYYERLENEFEILNSNDSIIMSWNPPMQKINTAYPNRITLQMSGIMSGGYFYDRNWLPRYLEANSRPTATLVEIIVPESMSLEFVSVISSHGEVNICSTTIGSRASINTIEGTGRITLAGDISDYDIRFSGRGELWHNDVLVGANALQNPNGSIRIDIRASFENGRIYIIDN